MRQFSRGRASLAALAFVLGGCAAQGGTASAPQEAVQKALGALGGAISPAQPAGAGPAGAGGKVVAINARLVTIEGPHPADPRWQGTLLAETPLKGLFAKHPISRPGDYWPRVALKVDDYSESLAATPDPAGNLATLPGSSAPGRARPIECLRMTAVVWMSAKASQRFERVVLCSSEIKAGDESLTIGALRNYRNLMAPISISSEQLRTFGPREPAKLLPDSDPTDIAIYSNGQHLFAALFTQMGYQGPIDGDQRLWFVSLSKRPG